MYIEINNLAWLMEFYKSLCNGDWEHSFGCSIGNSDNPGWIFEFELMETVFEKLEFITFVNLRSEKDWVNCQFEHGVFKGVGGPLNLEEIISVFRDWIDRSGL